MVGEEVVVQRVLQVNTKIKPDKALVKCVLPVNFVHLPDHIAAQHVQSVSIKMKQDKRPVKCVLPDTIKIQLDKHLVKCVQLVQFQVVMVGHGVITVEMDMLRHQDQVDVHIVTVGLICLKGL